MNDGNLVIRDLPLDERPREKMAQFGPDALSTAELLAILLRVGSKGESAVRMAERLLSAFGGLVELARAGIPQLADQKGLGLAKAAQLKAAFELGKRVAAAQSGFRPTIRSAEAAAALVMEELRYLQQECLLGIFLDTKSQLICRRQLTLGTLSGSPAHPREIFREAVTQGAASIILCHNHPSGDPTPSADDITLTTRLVKAGELMGVPVVDHIIIGNGRHVSLKDAGRM
jgi:DNA repair protein RadC